MAQNKIKINENGAVPLISKRRAAIQVHHWAFLEEMEAPMWADLTLEPYMTSDNNDDVWFHTSHSFHHLSARRLRSAFAHPDLGNDFMNFNLHGVCSPKLPPSVSKSRGKDYISKHQRNSDMTSVSKDHLVNESEATDCKPKFGLSNESEATDLVTSVLCSDSRSATICCASQGAADDRDTNGSINTQLVSTSGLSTSTITTVSQRQYTKPSEVSKEGFGMTGSLLNALKINLRKSRATRPALRVEVCGDDRELKSHKSSSGKSSVGSSSIGYDGKVKRSTGPTKNDHHDQVKMDINENMKVKGPNMSLTGKPSVGSSSVSMSNSVLGVKKIVVVNKQNRDKYLGVGAPEISVRPMNGRVTANKVSEVPVKKTAASLKLKKSKNSNAHDLGKSAPPLKGRVRIRKQVEPSVKTGICHSSRIEGRSAVVVASTPLLAVKSKVPLSENITNYTRLGVPAGLAKVGRAHFNGPSSFIKENVRRLPLSQISSADCNMPVVKRVDQKRPNKLSENKGNVVSAGSKVKNGKTDARLYLR